MSENTTDAPTFPEWVERCIAQGSNARAKALPRYIESKLVPLRLEGHDEPLPLECTRGLLMFARDHYTVSTPAKAFAELEPFEGLELSSAVALSSHTLILWARNKLKKSDLWLAALGTRFPNSDIVSDLAGKVMNGGSDYRKKSLEMLSRLATPEAFFTLSKMESNKSGQYWISDASSAAGASRRRFGLDAREFEDMSVPTLGLDVRGERRFDYGPRTIVARIHNGEFEFYDETNDRVYQTMPRKKKGDDVDKVARERDAFMPSLKVFRESARQVSTRLERDMLQKRTWRAHHVLERALGHPVFATSMRGLVWHVTYEDGSTALARPDEENQFIDAQMDPVDMDGALTLRIATITDLADTAKEWIEHFEDFEIVQPVDQLSNTQFTLDSDIVAELFHEIGANELAIDVRSLKKNVKKAAYTVEGRYYWYDHSYVVLDSADMKHRLIIAVEQFSQQWDGYSKDPVHVTGLGRNPKKDYWWGSSDPSEMFSTLEDLSTLSAEDIVILFSTLANIRASA